MSHKPFFKCQILNKQISTRNINISVLYKWLRKCILLWILRVNMITMFQNSNVKNFIIYSTTAHIKSEWINDSRNVFIVNRDCSVTMFHELFFYFQDFVIHSTIIWSHIEMTYVSISYWMTSILLIIIITWLQTLPRWSTLQYFCRWQDPFIRYQCC